MTENEVNCDGISSRTSTDALLGRRRVRVSDLLDAELLAPNDQLVWDRPRVGERYTAKVTGSGDLTLPDDSAHRTPSRAAKVAANVRSIDGWLAWTLERNGLTLDDLRRQLLHEHRSSDADSPKTHLFSWLEDTRKQVDTSQVVQLTVQDLLSKWEEVDRSLDVTEKVDTDLDNQGLATSPDYRTVALTATVSVTKKVAEPEADEPTSAPVAGNPVVTVLSVRVSATRIRVGRIGSATTLSSVTLEATLDEAITTMLLNDYSQLAVLSNRSRRLEGVISWRSVARARNLKHDATLRDAMGPAEVVSVDDDLLAVLPRVQALDFVLVQQVDGTIGGIVTAADVVELYGTVAAPFLMLGEIDTLLRRAISDTLALDEVRQLLFGDEGGESFGFTAMSMGQYCRTLENPAQWARLGWKLDRKAFLRRLEEVRRIRNDVMHFDVDQPKEEEMNKIIGLLDVLREYVD